MKKALLVVLALSLIFIAVASAGDLKLSTKIDSTTIAIDKNGAEYVRFIITEPRTLSGVEYEKSLPVMAFGKQVPAAKAMLAGDPLNAICNYRKMADGRESYTIISFIE
jgi:hypothetical protein